MATNAYISALTVGHKKSVHLQKAIEVAKSPADAGVDVGALSTVNRTKLLASDVWQDKQILLLVLEGILEINEDVVARGGTGSAVLMASARNSNG